MTLKNLVNIRRVLFKYANEKMSASLAYKFVKFLKFTESDALFYDEQFKKLFELYVSRDEDGNYIRNNDGFVVDIDKIQEYKEKNTELENIEISLPPIYFYLEEIDELSPSMSEIFILDEIIKGGENND